MVKKERKQKQKPGIKNTIYNNKFVLISSVILLIISFIIFSQINNALNLQADLQDEYDNISDIRIITIQSNEDLEIPSDLIIIGFSLATDVKINGNLITHGGYFNIEFFSFTYFNETIIQEFEQTILIPDEITTLEITLVTYNVTSAEVLYNDTKELILFKSTIIEITEIDGGDFDYVKTEGNFDTDILNI